ATPSVDPDGVDRLIPVSQAARLLAVHISTVRRWIRHGKLPAYRLGDKGVRVRYDDLMQLLTPLEIGQKDNVRSDDRSSRPHRLTDEEQHQARAAVTGARTLQDEFRARYGTMSPESWEILNESRSERTASLSPATEE
ncbi:MAG: helix-turn-helix domain-containing protein, partial [Chloroflexota bacterium]